MTHELYNFKSVLWESRLYGNYMAQLAFLLSQKSCNMKLYLAWNKVYFSYAPVKFHAMNKAKYWYEKLLTFYLTAPPPPSWHPCSQTEYSNNCLYFISFTLSDIYSHNFSDN